MLGPVVTIGFVERERHCLPVGINAPGDSKAGSVCFVSAPPGAHVRVSEWAGPPWASVPSVFSVLKHGSTSDHQRVKGLECRAVEFGFGLGGSGEIGGLT